MSSMDPKDFYNSIMPEKIGSDYEAARWRENPFKQAQYDMTADAIQRLATSFIRPAKHILEVGPGPGTWTKILLSLNKDAKYTLVDISQEMLARAKSALPTDAHIEFVESDFRTFHSEELADAFFSSRAIEYMPDMPIIVKNIAARLAPGSFGIIITKTPKQFFNRLRGRKISALHQGQISPRMLAKTLRAAGLRVVAIRVAAATVPGLGSVAFNRFIYSLIRNVPLFFPLTLFTESYCVVFEKP